MLKKIDLKLMYGYLVIYKRTMDEIKWQDGSTIVQDLISELFISIKDGKSSQQAMKQFKDDIKDAFSSTDDFFILLAHKLQNPMTLLPVTRFGSPRAPVLNQSNESLMELFILSKFHQVLNLVNNQSIINSDMVAIPQNKILQLAYNTVKYVPTRIACNSFFKPSIYVAGGITAAFTVDMIFFSRFTLLQIFLMPLRYALLYFRNEPNNPYLDVILIFVFITLLLALIPISVISYLLQESVDLSKHDVQEVNNLLSAMNINANIHDTHPIRQELQDILDKEAELVDDIKEKISRCAF